MLGDELAEFISISSKILVSSPGKEIVCVHVLSEYSLHLVAITTKTLSQVRGVVSCNYDNVFCCLVYECFAIRLQIFM